MSMDICLCPRGGRKWEIPRDLVRMRYRKRISGLPSVCACGHTYSLDHSQICKLGGFIHMRHDNVKRLFAYQAKQCFRDVELEPALQPLSGETFEYKTANTKPEARSDIRVRSFWTNMQNAFFDTKVIYPFASSYSSKTPCRTVQISFIS